MKHRIAVVAAATMARGSARLPGRGMGQDPQNPVRQIERRGGAGIFVQHSNCTCPGRALAIQVDEETLRIIVALLPDDVRLGVLAVRERGWQRPRHSRDLRQTIQRLDKP